MDPITVGLILGLGSTAYSWYQNDKQAEADRQAKLRALEALREQSSISDQVYQQMLTQIDDYYKNRGSLGTKQDVNEYKQAISEYNPEDYAADVGEFQYDKTKEDFLNPYYGKIISDAAGQIQHTAAGAGLGRGTGAALNIAKGTAEKSDELYRTALGEYEKDRAFNYQQYQDAIANNQNRLNAIRSGMEWKIGTQGNLAQDYFNVQDQSMSDRLKLMQDREAARSAYGTAMAGLY